MRVCVNGGNGTGNSSPSLVTCDGVVALCAHLRVPLVLSLSSCGVVAAPLGRPGSQPDRHRATVLQKNRRCRCTLLPEPVSKLWKATIK